MTHRRPLLAAAAALALLLAGCDGNAAGDDDGHPPGPPDDDDVADDDDDAADDDDTGDDDDDTTGDCPDGMICVDTFPFVDTADTAVDGARVFDAYGCSPGTDESGPEVVYRVTVPQAGWLGVAIDDTTPGVDVDAHILASYDPDDCLDRGNADAGADVDPGYVYVVADTYVSGGDEQSGPFTITIGHLVPHAGSCAMDSGWLDRVGDGGNPLQMPATGPVVLEAHLVTDGEGWAGGEWPSTITDGIETHYEVSQDETGFVMWRDQPWCPQEGCEYGQGSAGGPVPVEDEAWYVCMYWSSRPAAGTRMIVQAADGRAVVAAAGYETGPGDLSYIGGVPEEIHHYLGTTHGGELTIGFATDQTLPLGPITCP